MYIISKVTYIDTTFIDLKKYIAYWEIHLDTTRDNLTTYYEMGHLTV